MSSLVDATVLPGPVESASEQVRRWIEAPVEFWEACAREYGPLVALELGSLGRVVLVSDPLAIKQLFQLPSERFECRHYNEQYRYVMGDHSLLVQDGATHARQRRLLGPPLRREALLPEAAVIREIARATIERWPVGTPFNPRPDLHDITFQVMAHLLFGDQASDTSRALVAAYRESVAQQVGSWGPWRSFTRLQPRIRALLSEEVAARRREPERPGLLTAIAQARDLSGEPLADAECQDHVFSLMIAGVDTTAVSLTWALHWLCRENEVRARLVEEVASTSAGQPMPYLEAVFRETLRMYPIVPTPSGRKLTGETQIGGHVFARGTTLVPCTYLVHRREDLYPESSRFRPDRFLERRFATWEYFPFGGGVRRCVGEVLAQHEFGVVLPAILERWSLDPVATPPLRVVRHGTLLAPEDGFLMTVQPTRGRSE